MISITRQPDKTESDKSFQRAWKKYSQAGYPLHINDPAKDALSILSSEDYSLMKPESGQPPIAVFFCGANGSGKSAIRSHIDFDGQVSLHIDTDVITSSILGEGLIKKELTAGRHSIDLFRRAISTKTSFSMETTLSGASSLSRIKKAFSSGYEVNIIYVGLDSDDKNVERVAGRVMKGGHDIPEEKIRARYIKSRENIIKAIPYSSRIIVCDNSSHTPREVVSVINEGSISFVLKEGVNRWVTELLGNIVKGRVSR